MCSCHTNLWLILIVILIPVLIFSIFHLIAVIFSPPYNSPTTGKISVQSLRDKDKKE